MPNCERIDGDPLAMVRMDRAAGAPARLRGTAAAALAAIEAKGMLDPQTGLFTVDAFLRDLNRTVEAAKRQQQSMSLARYSFLPFIDRRAALDAARLTSRLVRSVDFACRTGDGSILLALPNTELRTAHVIARRIASGLKGTMQSTEQTYLHNDPLVTLAALRADRHRGNPAAAGRRAGNACDRLIARLALLWPSRSPPCRL